MFMSDSNKNTVGDVINEITKNNHILRLRALLVDAYNSKNTAASAVLDYLAFAEKHYKISSVQHLVAESKVDYYDVVKFLKYLDVNKFGQFIVGRKGQDSRIVWKYHPQSIGEVAVGKTSTILSLPDKLEEYDGGTEQKTIETHSFFLRPDFKLTIDLPIDFDHMDIRRLENWLATIPFD